MDNLVVDLLPPDRSECRLHSWIKPEEIRPGLAVSATLCRRSPGVSVAEPMTFRVWRLSPLAVELLVEASEDAIKPGDDIELTLVLAGQALHYPRLKADCFMVEQGRRLLGISLVPQQVNVLDELNRRGSERWQSDARFKPHCSVSDPVRFKESVYLSVDDVSAEGALMHTSVRNKFLLPGVQLSGTLVFPCLGEVTVNFEVKHVRVEKTADQVSLAVGCQWLNWSAKANQLAAQYVLQFSHVSALSDIRSAALRETSLSDAIRYDFVQTDEEYRDVLALRHAAYLRANKLAPGLLPADMADDYDERARIVIGRYKGRIVASCRLAFPGKNDALEQEQFVEWAPHRPKREDCVEVMRLCTDPDFRGGDIMVSIFQFITITIIQSGRSHAVLCATDDMFKLYRNMGFKPMGLSYHHRKLNNLKHHVLCGEKYGIMSGRDVGPVFWNLLYREALAYLQQHRAISLGPLSRARVWLYKGLAPWAKLLVRRYQSPRRITSLKPATEWVSKTNQKSA